MDVPKHVHMVHISATAFGMLGLSGFQSVHRQALRVKRPGGAGREAQDPPGRSAEVGSGKARSGRSKVCFPMELAVNMEFGVDLLSF